MSEDAMEESSYSVVEEKSAEDTRTRPGINSRVITAILFGTLGAYFWLVCVLGTIAGTEE